MSLRTPIAITASIVFLCLAGLEALSAPVQASNMDRLQQCARLLCDSMTAGYNRGDTVCLSTAAHPAAWLVDQAFLSAAELRGIRAVSCDRLSTWLIAPAITAIGVEYRATDDPDVLQRTSRLSLSAALPARPASPERITRTFEIAIVDSVETDLAASLNDPAYDFTRGVAATGARPGFWEKVVEPAVIVGSAAVMIILLFTVRSQ